MSRLADFHVHPDYSIDAEGDIDSYCRRALSLGLKAICFTPHYDRNPRRLEYDDYWRYKGELERVSDTIVEAYVEDVRKAGLKYHDRGLDIYCGLEIDYFPGAEEEAELIASKFEFDFLIGSVHCIEDIAISNPDEAKSYFPFRTMDEMADSYFDLLEKAASCTLFDCLGHLDYYVRYAREYYGDDLGRISIDRYAPVFKKLVASGVGIEVNTGRFRKGVREFHPAESIIIRAIVEGVRIASVGSDCHCPADLGKGIDEAYAFLESLSIQPEFPGNL